MRIIRFAVDDRLEMKKPHPCGSSFFTVRRTGSDIRILCEGCGRDVTVPRVKLEKGIKRVISAEERGEVIE